MEWFYKMVPRGGGKTGNIRLPRRGENQIVVLVRPFGAKNGDGSASGIPDVGIKKVLPFFSHPEINWDPSIVAADLPPPDQFFSIYGVVVVSLNQSNLILSHEVGHLLGAFHEVRFANEYFPQASPFTQINILRRKLGAYADPGGGYTTIMYSETIKSIDYFSSRTLKSSTGQVLGKNEDNRQAIINMVNYLAGQDIDPTPTFKEKILNIINTILDGDI